MSPSCKHLTLLLLAVAFLLLGCGGSSGSSTSSTAVQPTAAIVNKVWNLTTGPSRSPNVTSLSMALSDAAGQITGSASMVRGGKTFVGTLTGSATDTEVDLSIVWSSSLSWQLVVKFYLDSTGAVFALADVKENGTAIGTLRLVPSGPNNPPQIAGIYSGTWSSTTTDVGGSFSVMLVQNGNSLTGTYTIGNNSITSGTVASGSIIGTTVSLVLSTSGTSNVSCSDVINGTVYAPAYQGSWNGTTQDTGSFHLTKQ